MTNVKGLEKVEYHSTVTDVSQLVLVSPENPDPSWGIPLLDLGALDLPLDIEVKLYQELWAVGIKEYKDALKPGASDLIVAALRSTLKLSVQSIVELCQKEHKILQEAGYEQRS